MYLIKSSMKYPQLVSMPSAVSDWLEEQLEARGIDAVVYTRYVLSLLYRDPVDVIYPEQDLHVTHPNKEVRRTGGSRKRFRRSSEWWGHTQADADQLKRTAAVECLMSASDQKCGIESLVDELCEKLKEVNNKATSNTESTLPKNQADVKLSPQDLAKQYYAAFPPLSRSSSNTSSTNLITLIPKWFGSPKKKAKKQNRSASYDEKLHSKLESDGLKTKSCGKQKLNYFGRNRRDIGYCRNIAKSMKRSESMTDWNLYVFNDNDNKKVDSEVWPQQLGLIPVDSTRYSNIMKDINDESEECSWNDLDENLNMYDDLPVDIRELLNSPVPQVDPVKMMNLANMRDTGNKSFISNGTNIISSIWSNDSNLGYDSIYENTYNTALDFKDTDTLLGVKLSTMTLDNSTLTSAWPSNDDLIAENERNLFFESCEKSTFFGNFNIDNIELNTWHVTPSLERWSDGEFAEDDLDMLEVTKSLEKIGHKKDESAFAEVYPRPRNPFTMFSQSTNSIKLMLKKESIKIAETDAEKEDLLYSAKTHFRPIGEKLDEVSLGKYVDGTTFVIPSNLDKVDYKRSDSGSLLLDDEYGVPKKYYEYNNAYLERNFITKFKIIQNDKTCQADFDFPLLDNHVDTFECKTSHFTEDLLFPGDHELLTEEYTQSNEYTCSCNDNLAMKLEFSFGNDLVNCPVHLTRPDSVTAEIFGNYETKCDKCSKNIASWNTDWVKTFKPDRTYDRQSEKDIWNGEICVACLRLNEKRPPLSQEQNQFRQELKRDGEQLLSDISCLQKSYMEEIPITDVPSELNDLLVAKDIKRRHSTETSYYGCIFLLDDNFSFASRLEQDCMNKLTSVIPTLRSVTL